MASARGRPAVLDPFLLAILSAVAIATVMPCRGVAAVALHHLATAAVIVLFFLHGAKLSREAIVASIGHVRLHALVIVSTFVFFPLAGILLRPVAVGAGLVSPSLYEGVLFLCALPATVQSAVVLTSIAGGNVPAAICSASLSTVLGVVLTPLALRISGGGAGGDVPLVESLVDVGLKILAPFTVGHLARPLVGSLIAERARLVGLVDRGSIVLVVYVSFSDAVVQDLWQQVSPRELAGLFAVCAALLAAALLFTRQASRAIRLPREDEIAVVFGGSKKSLASGVAMASVLYTGPAVGLVVLPLMIFHQMQLMLCTYLAGRYAAGGAVTDRHA